MILDLFLDIKCYIASFDEIAWYLMYRYDSKFREYAVSSEGIKRFRTIFNQSHYTINYQGDGCTEWRLLGKLHRESGDRNKDQPAVIYDNGMLSYYKFGVLHRDGDKPSIKHPSHSYRSYYKHGQRHRDNTINGESQPSFISNQYGFEYRQNDVFHREGDFPAIMYADGTIEYYKNGKLHRDNDINGNMQPACIYPDGTSEYFKNDVYIITR